MRSDEWTARLHDHHVLGHVGVYVDDLLIAGPRSLNDSMIRAVQEVWKTSAPEHLGPDPDCVPILRFLGMNLERVNEEKSEELGLPVGSVLLNQMEYGIEVLMKFEPSLQLKTRTTPGNQESFASKQVHHVSTEQALQEYVESLQALADEDIIEADKVKTTSTKLHYNSDQVPTNLPAIVRCLNWITLRTRPDIAWATSRAASLINHDPDTCFIRLIALSRECHGFKLFQCTLFSSHVTQRVPLRLCILSMLFSMYIIIHVESKNACVHCMSQPFVVLTASF